jgi:hypothetical protein
MKESRILAPIEKKKKEKKEHSFFSQLIHFTISISLE